MRIWKKICSLIIVCAMLLNCFPIEVLAATQGPGDYSIANEYIRYTINSHTGGFCIETIDGHPQKTFDNNIPLLYKEDRELSNGTSFTTIRIDGKDYIFGQDYGWFGLSSKLDAPVVSNEGRLITVRWTIKDYEIIQRVALSIDENNPLCGNAGISYEVKNNSGKPCKVGIRVMLDNALDSKVDAPFVVADTSISPTIVETEYAKGNNNLPTQLRFMDSLSSPEKMAYTILQGWSGRENVQADRVIIGHWANLANTRYAYAPDPSCDFSNYSNKHRVPDTATAYYWNEKDLAAGENREAEMLYGIGNFSRELSGEKLGINMNVGTVNLDGTGKAYANGGEFDIKVSLDNSVTGANPLIEPILKLTLEDGLTFKSTGTKEYVVKYDGGIDKGSVKDVTTTVIASPQYQITSKRIVASVTGTEYIDDKTNQIVDYSANRNVLLPAVGGILPDIQMTQVSPETVYYAGDKNITISGDMKAFTALKGSAGWDLYLVPQATGDKDKILINKKHIAFTDDTYQTMSVSTEKELTVGTYDIVFEFKDAQLEKSFGKKITAAVSLNVSASEYYKARSYGMAAMVRFNNADGENIYDIVTFATEEEFAKFESGTNSANGILRQGITLDAEGEVLTVVRGKIRELSGSGGKYYEVNPADGDVTINNIMSYCGTAPLSLRADNFGGGDEVVSIEGDGTVKVINSINVWHNEWSIKAEKGTKYTLNQDDIDEEDEHSPSPLELSLDGAGSVLQMIGGFLIDLKFGVLTQEENLNGISFGGNITLPIKVPGGKDNKDDKKDNDDEEEEDEDSPEISAEIESILYGERSNEPVGFVGIDSKFSVKLPADVLGSMVKNPFGVEAEVTINTIDNFYRLDLGVELVMFECQGIIALKQVPVKGVDRILPDEVFFKISGDIVQIPVVPPFLFMTGLGGGISNLADTIGDSVSQLPPLTIKLYTQLSLIETMQGDFDMALSLSGFSMEGVFKLNGDDDGKIMKIKGGLAAQWIDPFYISAYGNATIYDGMIKGGITIKISENYFYGYIFAAFYIPDSIPFVGGKELAGVEAAVSSDFLGANIRIIGIKFGFIYYWDGDFHFGKGIDLSSRGGAVIEAIDSYYDSTGKKVEYSALYGTNLRRLASTRIASSRAGTAAITKEFDPTKEDALLIEVPFEGANNPTKEEIILVSPSSITIEMSPDDGKGNGNYLIQEREGKKYLYITIADKALLEKGQWKLSIATEGVTAGDFVVNGVDNLPEITETSYEYSGSGSHDLTVSWKTDSQSSSAGVLDIYLTKDANALEKIRKEDTNKENVIESIVRVELDQLKEGKTTVKLPEAFPSGEYYVVSMLSQNEGGMSAAMSTQSFTFENKNLPKDVKAVNVAYGGNGNLKVNITDNENIDYNNYIVKIEDENGKEVENTTGQYKVGSEILLGAAAGAMEEGTKTADGKPTVQMSAQGLTAGKKYIVSVKTLNQTEDNLYYGSNEIKSEAFVMPQVNLPSLTAVSGNIKNAEGNTVANTNITKYEAVYSFDQPVAFSLKLDGRTVDGGKDYKDIWAVNVPLEDGKHVVDFEARNQAGDMVTGVNSAKEPNAQLGFEVDSHAPVLTLGEAAVTSMGENAEPTTVANQTVMTDLSGNISLKGLTEKSAELTLDGTKDGITIHNDGTFEINRSISNSAAYTQQMLKAVDKAGNETRICLSIVNSDLVAFGSVMLSNAKDSIKTEDGIRFIEMSVGQNQKLTAYGIKDNKQFAIDDSNVVWNILYEKNIIDFADGMIIAKTPGETAIRASYKVGQFEGIENVEGKVEGEISDVIVIRITDPGYRYNLMQTDSYTLFTIASEINLGDVTVTIGGKETKLLYDSERKVYQGAFEGIVTSENIVENMSIDKAGKPAILLYGDVDNDGKAGLEDVAKAISIFLSGNRDPQNDLNSVIRADMNKDNVIDIIDAQLMFIKTLK